MLSYWNLSTFLQIFSNNTRDNSYAIIYFLDSIFCVQINTSSKITYSRNVLLVDWISGEGTPNQFFAGVC